MKKLILAVWLLVIPTHVFADDEDSAETTSLPCPAGFICVEKNDMDTFFQLAKDHRCRATTDPSITVDPVNIIVDKEGRVLGSGTGKKPHEIHIDWCNYGLDFKSQIGLQVAQQEVAEWGFRLRVKATMGVLGSEIFEAKNVQDIIDLGVLLEPFYFHWINLNAYVGVRSFGAGVGVDLTTNTTLYLGYSMLWGEWSSSPFVSIGFAL